MLCSPLVASEWFQPYTPPRGDDSDARSTPEVPVVQGLDGVEQPTESNRNVATRNNIETNKYWANMSPNTDDMMRLWFRPSARRRGVMDRGSKRHSEEKAIMSSRGRSLPTATQSDGMGDMTTNSVIFTLPEPLQYRRSLSEDQIHLCIRCGQRHPGPWSIIYPPSMSIPIPCEPATGVQQAEITLRGRGSMKELMMMLMAAFLFLIVFFDWLTRTTNK